MNKVLRLFQFYFCFIVLLTSWNQVLAQKLNESGNLLLNPYFEFHSFINHRDGIPISYSSKNVAFWNTDSWGNIEVMRESHVSTNIRPKFSTHNLVAISPGKKMWQFFTLPQAGLAHGDHVNLSVFCYQPGGDMLKAKIKLLKLDSQDGTWSPRTFGMTDNRTFPKHSRGELVVEKTFETSSSDAGNVVLKVENAEVVGQVSFGNRSNSNDMNTIGIQVEFENVDPADTVWIYYPSFTVTRNELQPVPLARNMVPLYKHIPRTMQKLWKGEPIHIIIMGSSIDRGSANPNMYLYDEDPHSKSFKQPIAEDLFDGAKVEREDLDSYFGGWRHYFSYVGRLKLELMRKFNLTPDKICLNFMACDGSSIGEAHSGLEEYCSLSLPPDPEMNGQKSGESWKQLYPELFSRLEGPRPDLVIFGSGANEKTDTPDEVAVFEGMIRWIQRHYPDTEFLFAPFQNFGGYTSNSGDLQALSLRYQIPYLDYGKTIDDAARWCNRYALIPIDGHPQAAAHFLWFKQLENAFECWDPIVSGEAQLQLPDRLHNNSYGWEGEMETFDKTSKRLKENRFIFEDIAVNCWGKSDSERTVAYVDGVKFQPHRSSPDRDIRNSLFSYGNCKLGDRHILEIEGENAELTYVDSKICPNRQIFTVDNPRWNTLELENEHFDSKWGAPYGSKMVVLKPGNSIEIEIACTDISVAYVDQPKGGTLDILIDDQLRLSQPSNIPFIDTDNGVNFIENRKGILNLGFGLHKVRLEAKEASVEILGIFTYDKRPNFDSERRLTGVADGGETLEFTLPFKARPIVFCSGGLSVESENISKTKVKFSGTSGYYECIGE